mgnify:CR=1 FL=1
MQDDLIKQMEEVIDSLNQLILPVNDEVGEFAKATANYEYLKEKRKFVLAQEMEKYNGSNADRKAKAEGSKAYLNALREEKKAKGKSMQVKAEKDLLMAKLDSLRTRISYNKYIDNSTM